MQVCQRFGLRETAAGICRAAGRAHAQARFLTLLSFIKTLMFESLKAEPWIIERSFFVSEPLQRRRGTWRWQRSGWGAAGMMQP